jgi:hypothetical protein
VRSPLHTPRRKAEQLRAEIEQDIAAIDAYEQKYGSFAEMVRQHYRDDQECA